jgi:hypothetical protein
VEGRAAKKKGPTHPHKLVLSNLLIYHMPVFSHSKWVIQKIDKIRRQFLWCGAEDSRKGNCLVNSKRVQRLKHLGGLGILDLERFNRALRLRWQWRQWQRRETSTQHPCTTITIENGQHTKFWLDRWLH